MKRVLVITPKLPYPATGADEQDRFYGIKLLQDMGFEVQVISKVFDFQKEENTRKMSKTLNNAVIHTVLYRKKSFSLDRLKNLYWIDGAAYEYTDPMLRNVFDTVCSSFSPDVVWVDGSYAWPIAWYAKKKGFKTILRSINIESRHLLTDEGYSIPNLIRAFSKELGERSLNKRADSVFAITESEKDQYRKRGVNAETLPLRSLPYILEDEPHIPKETKILKVVYSGSTYSVGHNRKAAELIIKKVAPQTLKDFGESVSFHITGSKLPESLLANLPKNVSYEGYVNDYKNFLLSADVVLAPSLGGAGMQQKIFEPIARGIPTITTKRGLAGYPFVKGKEVFLAETPEEMTNLLKTLTNLELRRNIGSAGKIKASQVFSKKILQKSIHSTLFV